MSKAYLLFICLFFSSLSGCITDDSVLEDAYNDFIDSINTGNWKTYCKYIAYTYDDTTNEVILSNNTELDECAEASVEDYDYEYKITISNYVEEKLDYKVANNSGFVYSVDFAMEYCEREDEFGPWYCSLTVTEEFGGPDENILWVEVDGQWLYLHTELEYQGGVAQFNL